MPSGVTVGQEIDSVFRSNNSIGDRLICGIEHSNTHSDVAIAIKRGSQVIWHVPERLARIPSPMMKDGRIRRIDGYIPGAEWLAPEGVWTMGEGIELPCYY